MSGRKPGKNRPGRAVVWSARRMCRGVCKVLGRVEKGRIVKVAVDLESPTIREHICPMDVAPAELSYHSERLTHLHKRMGLRGESR